MSRRVQNEYSASISCDQKASPIYKNHIANLALADAEHDLGEVLTTEFSKQNSSLLRKFNEGIPYASTRPINKKIQEEMALNSVFSDDSWKSKVLDVTDGRKDDRLLDIRFKKGQTYFTYNAVKFCIKSHEGNNPPSRDFGKTFVA